MQGIPPLPSFNLDTPDVAMSDNDTNKLVYKNDNQGIVNLTPSTSYKCKTIGGELSWDATNLILTVSGTVFIDGSATVQNGSTNLYKGSGVIYLSGTFLLKNSKLCPYSSTTCDTTKWNNQQDLLGIVANGNSSNVADAQTGMAGGDGIALVSAYMMGAGFATNNMDIGTTSTFDGPIDAATVLLGRSSPPTLTGF